jgi:CheY-like chemotaxis protein
MQDNASSPILLVEDNEGDIFLFKRLAKKAGIGNPVQVVYTGEQAVEYLAGAGKYSDRAQYAVPSLVLLDLKLPRKDGFEVLEWVRSQADLSNLNVVVLTSSSESRDIERARGLGALSYLTKPPDIQALVEIRLRINELNSPTEPLGNIPPGLLGYPRP